MVSVYAGQRCIGFLLNRGKLGWEAVTATERSLGTHSTQQEAADAIERARLAEPLEVTT
jgi:hypothetical protein